MTPFEVDIINSVLQLGKMKLRDVKGHDQGHAARKKVVEVSYE